MRVVAGLGNPWPVPRLSRHNAGVLLVDLLREQLGLEWRWHWSCLCWLARSAGDGRDEGDGGGLALAGRAKPPPDVHAGISAARPGGREEDIQ
ncbi:unnamed protein product [Prorocentrum cordatum]|uniref:Peptidyl-tRNA hydrolase n=1 Tax=Prorocentrum cordatum TaxID=2364126 RepID=A0ABN9UZY7_9DINO|nr:unnamed protein product [Polarella glacialis]